MTTVAYKLAGGVDSSSSLSKPLKQNLIPQIFVSKITKAFLDALYAFLDGLVLLASDESPIVSGKGPNSLPAEGLSPLELLDLKDGVRYHEFSIPFEIVLMFYALPAGYPPTSRHIKLWTPFEGCDTEHAHAIRECFWHFLGRR